MSKSHFILVHGSYHQPWHLHLLKDRLEAAGYTVSAPHLPSSARPSQGTLARDISVIKATLEQAAAEAKAIIPVFHSYAGIPGSEAIAEVSDAVRAKIHRAVYLAAFVIDQGTSLIANSGGKPVAWSVIDGDTRYVPDPMQVFYHDVEPTLAAQAVEHVLRQAYEPLNATTKHAGWRLVPVTYITCTDDRAIPMKLTQDKITQLLAQDEALAQRWEVLTLASGHSPFLSMPDECARVLRRCAGEEM